MKRCFRYAKKPLTGIVGLLLLLTAAQGACGDPPSPCDVQTFGLDAGKFYLYLTKDTPYSSWQIRPGSTMHRADSPHGPLAKIYVNPAAFDSISAGEELKPGSLIVMENREDNGTIQGLSVRLKIKGYNPAGNDWYWLQYNARGEATAEGRGATCLGCHGVAEMPSKMR